MVAVSAITPPPVPTLYENGVIAGPWPCTFPFNWRPAFGGFVYLLLDSSGVVAYVGQTTSLLDRLKRHGKNKAFASWTAKPSNRDRLELEAALIEKHRPYLYNDGTRRVW